jgi:hypothetical protein
MKLSAGSWTGADFIVLNRCDSGLIERESRHAIRVMDIDALKKKSPLASLLSAVFEKGRDRQEISLGRCAEGNASVPFHEDRGAIPPFVAAGSLSSSSAPRGGW